MVLGTESAYRAQLMINDMLQNAAMAIKRTSQLYTMGQWAAIRSSNVAPQRMIGIWYTKT